MTGSLGPETLAIPIDKIDFVFPPTLEEDYHIVTTKPGEYYVHPPPIYSDQQ